MTREEQRQATVRARRARRARKRTYTTLPGTIELTADDIDNMLRQHEDVELFKDYPSKSRRRMARAGQALPDGSYPIADCADAANAIRAVGRAKPGDRDRVRSHIRKRVRALGCSGSIYENWK